MLPMRQNREFTSLCAWRCSFGLRMKIEHLVARLCATKRLLWTLHRVIREIPNRRDGASAYGLTTSLVTLLALGTCKGKGETWKEIPRKASNDDGAVALRNDAGASRDHAAIRLEIKELGVMMDVPAGTELIEKNGLLVLQGGQSNDAYPRHAPGWTPGGENRPTLQISVSQTHRDSPATMDHVVDKGFARFDVVKSEVEGGWDITYEHRSWSLFDNISDYQVHVRRTINGKSFDCRTTSPGKSSRRQQETALLACRSLRGAAP